MPTTHGTHTALASTASWPSGQRHADAPAVENLSAAHGTQVSSLAAPVAVEYLPAAHSTHVLQSAAYCPAAHTTGAGVVMGSAVVVVGSCVVLEVVGSGVVLDVEGAGHICLMYSTYPYSDHPSSSAFPYVHRHATWSSGESAGESPFT